MPDSKSTPRRRRYSLTTDDLLIRLCCLTEAEQENVLMSFAAAIIAAETRIIQRESRLCVARHRDALAGCQPAA